jgi:mitochondrial fission protein ELM1
MNTLRLKAQTGDDCVLKLEVPTTPNHTFDVVLVMQSIEESVDANG